MVHKRSVEQIRKFNRFYANVLGKIDQEIYNQPFPLTEARVITEINNRNGCTATQVRETLGIDRGYMSRIIQKFEEDGIIAKKRSSTDKRQYLLYLTDQGEEIYKKLVENANREVGKMVQMMPESDLSKLVSSMESIQSLYEKPDSKRQFIIRSYQPGDVGYVAHLHGRFYDEHYNFGRLFEYYVMKGLTEFMVNSEGGDLWIAEVNGEIAGSIAITRTNDQVAQLRWFMLDANYHGLGIGNRLMETAVSFCRENSYQHVFLWTVNILDAARHLYQKFDFTLTEEKANNEWTGNNLIEERWDLDLT